MPGGGLRDSSLSRRLFLAAMVLIIVLTIIQIIFKNLAYAYA